RLAAAVLLGGSLLAPALARRAAERPPTGPPVMRVRAPFVVLNGAGKPILKVDRLGGASGVQVCTPSGEPVASLTGDGLGGSLKVAKAGGSEVALLGIRPGTGPALSYGTGSTPRMALALDLNGKARLEMVN